jgi:hypothetical protein
VLRAATAFAIEAFIQRGPSRVCEKWRCVGKRVVRDVFNSLRLKRSRGAAKSDPVVLSFEVL